MHRRLQDATQQKDRSMVATPPSGKLFRDLIPPASFSRLSRSRPANGNTHETEFVLPPPSPAKGLDAVREAAPATAACESAAGRYSRFSGFAPGGKTARRKGNGLPCC